MNNMMQKNTHNDKEMQPFNLLEHAFQKGASLIEASAGTGKTFSIAMLVVRLVVEKAIPIEEILVVTFTNAATEELRDRVRARLVDARAVLLGQVSAKTLAKDKTLRDWSEKLAQGGYQDDQGAVVTTAVALERLAKALADVDQASIYTIHSFCQSVIKAYPLESGQSFKIELTSDISKRKDQVLQDFWRRNFYERSEAEVALLLSQFKTPAELADILSVVKHPDIRVEPAVMPLNELLIAMLPVKQQVTAWVSEHHSELNEFVDAAIREGWLYADAPSTVATNWANVFEQPTVFFDHFSKDAFKKTHLHRVDEKLTSLNLPQQTLTELKEKLTALRISIQQALLSDYFSQLEKTLTQQNQMSFDSLIFNLANALKGDKSTFLKEQVQAKYQAALIDEFQDTDADQWYIFSSFFVAPKPQPATHYLYLIGDPKQAIYKFRGADIYAYLAASKACDQHYTLDTNWRSVPNMVTAVNDLFKNHDNPFNMQELAFRPVEAGRTGKEEEPAMHWWQMPTQANNKPWNMPEATSQIQAMVIQQIEQMLADGATPKDFAVLVRSNKSAEVYQQVLATAKIPAVIKTTATVFASAEANELLTVMHALAEPNDTRKAKQALAISWFAKNGNTLYDTLNSNAFESWLDSLTLHHQIWQQKSFIAALVGLMESWQVEQNLAQYPNGARRITNLLHLAELVQKAALSEHLSMTKTLGFLARQITTGMSNDEVGIRLETDAEAVQIITMHSAKGLQYRYVFCPELWLESELKNTKVVKLHEDGKIVVDLGSSEFDRRKKQALEEVKAEDLRIAYVALTRAEEKTFAVWGTALKGYDKSPLGYLLQKAEPPTGDAHCHHFSVGTSQLTHQPSTDTPDYQAKAFTRPFIDKRHRLFSFSGLIKHLEQETPVDKSDETDHDALALLLANKAQTARLPKGSAFGTLVHDLLEVTAFDTLAEQGIDPAKRDEIAAKQGVKWQAIGRTETEQHTDFDEMMRKIVTTPLESQNGNFTLAQIPAEHCLKEMGFYYAVKPSQTAQINALLTASDVPFMPLGAKDMAGHLNGFVDLIVMYQNKFYVMDYKTNFLGNAASDYSKEAMAQEMTHHVYGLQFMLYTLALHQYLKHRVTDYDYETHFGGVKYLFVRGMDGKSSDYGVYDYRPDIALITALEAILLGVNDAN